MLHGYRLDPATRSTPCGCCAALLHGFATLEAADGFQMATDVDESFDWLVEFLDRGLEAVAGRP